MRLILWALLFSLMCAIIPARAEPSLDEASDPQDETGITPWYKVFDYSEEDDGHPRLWGLRIPTFEIGLAYTLASARLTVDGIDRKIPMNQEFELWPSFTLISPPYYLSEDGWGIDVVFPFSFYAMEYDPDIDDDASRAVQALINTGYLRGITISAIPTLFYQWGDRKLCDICTNLRTSLGAGISYLHGEGAIVPKLDNIPKYDAELRGIGWELWLETAYVYGPWRLAFSVSGPTYRGDGNEKIQQIFGQFKIAHRFY